jgi:riboflavin biosynthesis pyrimidine reductase
MVEGGAGIITSFLGARLVDLLVLTVAPLLVGGLRGVGDLGVVSSRLPHLRDVTYLQLGGDLIVCGELDWGAT